MSTLATLEDGFSRAWAAGPRHERWLCLAGRRVQLRLAGAGLGTVWEPVWAHLFDEAPPDGHADLTVELWETDELPASLPLQGGFSADSRWYYERLPHMAAVLDRATSGVLGCATDIDCFSNFECGRPLLPWLALWLHHQGLPLLHAGACAWHGQGVLFVGPSGSGKTSCALHGWLSGAEFLAEDMLALETTASGFVAHSLYGSANLRPIDLAARFPSLGHAARGPQGGEEKTTVSLVSTGHGRLRRQAPIVAVVLPRVIGRGPTRLPPISRGQMLLALAPTSYQLNPMGRDARSFHAMAALVSSVACWGLELGEDAAEALSTLPQQLLVGVA